MNDLVGKNINRYHILEQLGQGGMAVVYKAFDTRLERYVALKVIRSGKEHSEKVLIRFEQEAKALAKLSHPNIVKVLDYGHFEGIPYLVMEYIPGGTLKTKLGKALPWEEVLHLIIPIANALAYAHEQSIIHRDVKSANILITENGYPMLADFGIAKMFDLDETLDLTGTGVGIGTPEYMAPEQASSKTFDHRVDIYALGIVLFELLTGKKPYQADTPAAVLLKHATEPIPRIKNLRADLPEKLEQVLIKSLQKDPNNRYQNMRDFALALEKILAEETIKQGQQTSGKSIKSNVLYPLLGFSIIVILLILFLIKPFEKKNEPGDMAAIPTLETLTTLTLNTKESITLSKTISPTRTIENTLTPTTTITKTPIPEIVNPSDQAQLIQIPAGEFLMGSNEDEDPYFWGAEGPKHKVILDYDYYIYQTEVTNAMYQECVADKQCPQPTSIESYTRPDYYENEYYANYPVVNITWVGAQSYCVWAGGRLPLEAEWEKAARGTDGRLFPWGNEAPDETRGNFCDTNCPASERNPAYDDGYRDTAPVGLYPDGVSPYGVYNMSGNVNEWVYDWFQPLYYEISPELNPEGPAYGNNGHRVARGGSFYHPVEGMRTVGRIPKNPNEGYSTIGFRCMIEISKVGE